MNFRALLLLLVFYTNICQAQIEGFVSADSDGEVLPFTHVYHSITGKGAYTDINGHYRIHAKVGDQLRFSYVGFETQQVTVSTSRMLDVRMKPAHHTLSEVYIRPGTNPAHRIINHVIARRTANNPNNRPAYSCTLYNRLTLDMMPGKTDSGKATRYKIDTTTYLMINEAVVRRQYKYRNNASDQIVASQTSGFTEYQQPAFIQMVMQFFHFYDEVIEWKIPVKFYLNPIGRGSTSKYTFVLRDTIVAENTADTTFVISYQPNRTARFDGLKGLLYINSNGWALQSIVAEPADATSTRLKIQQQYARVDTTWFPAELSLELLFANVGNTGIDAAYRGKTYIRDIRLSPNASAQNIRSNHLTLADDAWQRKDVIEQYRNRALSAREDSTFKRFAKADMDAILQMAEGVADSEALAVGMFDFAFERFVRHNYYEGFRLGAGVYTNRHLSPWFSAGGYYGYGLKDRKSKYGASLAVYPEKHLDSEIKLWWGSDLLQMTHVVEAGVSARKVFGKFSLNAFFKTQKLKTAFDYRFRETDMQTEAGRNTEARVRIRYAHNEERAKIFRRTQPLFSTQPIVYLDLYWGIPDCLGGMYRYLKTEVAIERSWYIRNVGHTRVTLRGGWNSANVPFPLTFTVTDTEQTVFFYPDWSAAKFNVITGNVYSSDCYLNAFVYHDFGTLLGKTRSKVFRPRISVAQAFGWSRLNHRALHASAQLDILDMRAGYFETGLIVEDLLRVNWMCMVYVGLGGGIYGAYGRSVRAQFWETLTPKLRITATF